MPPLDWHTLNLKIAVMSERFDAIDERQDRIDGHLNATDARVDELRKHMWQIKALVAALGVGMPLIIKYLLPR